MESSVSVLFPVHNAQATLQADIGRVLEVLPELSPRFDVLIIDDGSTDATAEIAHELSLCYPQVHLLRRAQRLGLAESLRSGLHRTDGEVILVHDAQGGVEADELPRLWKRRHDPAGGGGGEDHSRKPTPTSRWFFGWLPSQQKTAQRHEQRRSGGFHLLKRSALRTMQKVGVKHSLTAAATQQPLPSTPSTVVEAVAPRIDLARSTGATPRPSFLRKLREFAIGE